MTGLRKYIEIHGIPQSIYVDYGSVFRYPTEFEIPDLKDSELAIKHAQSIIRFVLKKLREPETGQTSILD